MIKENYKTKCNRGLVVNSKHFLPIILLTDFGYQDPFAGILKGVISKISPYSKVIDLSHGIRPQNILEAAFLLLTSFSYFPSKSIFCVVVDPGVGSKRKPICIETAHNYFVGPDNGVLWLAANKDKIKRIIHLKNSKYFLDTISSTFHGRDIFSPVCAHISRGFRDLSILGVTVDKCVKYELPTVKIYGPQMELTIINIDRFGNMTLNITVKEFHEFIGSNPFILKLHDCVITHVYQSYSEAMGDEPFLIESSSLYMEISIKNDNAALRLNSFCLDNLLLTSQK